MKKFVGFFAFAALVMMICGCASSRNVPYFKNIDRVDLSASKGLYDARIMPKDELTINVNASDPKVVEPFNLTVQNQRSLSSNSLIGGSNNSNNGYMLPYLVDNNGDINFPVLGRLHVMGLTKNECEKLIRDKIKPYLNEAEEPIVTVRMSSYRVTVIGEVGGSRVVPVTTEKMSVIEAIASAGDLTIYGVRNNILLIREDETGEKTPHRLNLNDANILNSPYYYVQQNDIIYVQPNKVKVRNYAIGATTTVWFAVTSMLTSVASLVVNILNND